MLINTCNTHILVAVHIFAELSFCGSYMVRPEYSEANIQFVLYGLVAPSVK